MGSGVCLHVGVSSACTARLQMVPTREAFVFYGRGGSLDSRRENLRTSILERIQSHEKVLCIIVNNFDSNFAISEYST